MTEEQELYARLVMSDEVWREQYGGEFVPRGGRVFKEFSRGKNVFSEIGENKILKGGKYGQFENLIGIDYGARNETAIIFCAKIGETHVIYDEIYRKYLRTKKL